MKKKKPNKILETMHQTAKDFHAAGLMDAMSMAEFDALCLPPVKIYSPTQIKKLRHLFEVS